MSLILSFSVDGTGKTLEEERLLLLVPVLYIGRWYGWEQFGWCSAQTHTQNTQSLSDLPAPAWSGDHFPRRSNTVSGLQASLLQWC